MSFCEHCAGQRFDRAQVLRSLRALMKTFQQRDRRSAEEALSAAIEAIRRLDIPHLAYDEDDIEGEIVH